MTDFHDFGINRKRRPYPILWYKTTTLLARKFHFHRGGGGNHPPPLGNHVVENTLGGRGLSNKNNSVYRPGFTKLSHQSSGCTLSNPYFLYKYDSVIIVQSSSKVFVVKLQLETKMFVYIFVLWIEKYPTLYSIQHYSNSLEHTLIYKSRLFPEMGTFQGSIK